MKCPSCNENITIGNVDRCEYCGFMAPGARHFANCRSFAEWKSQTKLLEYGQDELFDLDPTVSDSSAEAQIETGPSAKVLSPFVPLKTPNKEKAANTASVVKPQSRTKAEPAAKASSPFVPINTTNETKATSSTADVKPEAGSMSDAASIYDQLKVPRILSIVASVLLLLRWIVSCYFLQNFYYELESSLSPLSYLISFAVWITILIAFISWKRKKLMTVGLVLLAISRFLQVITVFSEELCYGYWNSISYEILYFFAYVLVLFLPALVLLIDRRRKSNLLWLTPGACFILCSIVQICTETYTGVFSLFFSCLYIFFFFAAGSYLKKYNDLFSETFEDLNATKSAQDELKPVVLSGRMKIPYAISIIDAFILSILSTYLYFANSRNNAIHWEIFFSSYLLISFIWIFLLVAFIARKHQLLMTMGLLLLSASRLLEGLLYVFFNYLNPRYLLNPKTMFYMLVMFIPALLLLIESREKVKNLWFIPGVCSVLCSAADIYILGFNGLIGCVFAIIYITFFFAAGRYFHLLNGNDSSDKKKKDDMSVHNEPDVETLK